MSSFLFSGIRINPMTSEEAILRIASLARSRHMISRAVFFVNAYSVTVAAQDETFRKALNQSTISLADGAPVSWVARWAGHTCQRISGPDAMHRLLVAPEFADLRHFVYGGTPDSLERLQFRYNRGGSLSPRRIIGIASPPFREPTESEIQDLVREISALKPDILWVCLGTRKQEVWVTKMVSRIQVPLMCAVGAAVDFLSGSKPRAPRWLQRIGMEWFFRLATEPGRLWRRYLIGNAVFARLVVRELLRKQGEEVP